MLSLLAGGFITQVKLEVTGKKKTHDEVRLRGFPGQSPRLLIALSLS